MSIDGHAVERAIKRISKEMGYRLYGEDGEVLSRHEPSVEA